MRSEFLIKNQKKLKIQENEHDKAESSKFV